MKRVQVENLIIRNETHDDWETVEHITREAFWNIYAPGCDEHYLVHIMRGHEDFIAELDLVAEFGDEIVGNVMYTTSVLTDENGNTKNVLTFGPLTVHPDVQRHGIGKKLLEKSFEKALEMGYDTIVIFGNPGNYVGHGFKSCKKYNICIEGDVFPTAMLVKELKENTLDGRKWVFKDSDVFHYDKEKTEEFDKQFAPKEKKIQPSQEEFYIYSNSALSGKL